MKDDFDNFFYPKNIGSGVASDGIQKAIDSALMAQLSHAHASVTSVNATNVNINTPRDRVTIKPVSKREISFFSALIEEHGIKEAEDDIAFVININDKKYAAIDFLEFTKDPYRELTMQAVFKILKDVDELLLLQHNQKSQNDYDSKKDPS